MVFKTKIRISKLRNAKATFESYADCLMTSGAIQKGVPTNVFLLLVVVVNWPATPKSANFTSPISDSKTFAAVGREKVKLHYKK